jgi:hypothetical protein
LGACLTVLRLSSFIFGHDPLQRRNILEEQLILEIDRVCRDHHALAALGREHGRGHQVGQPFAGSGSGLDHHRLAVVEGVGHRLGHHNLRIALLVALEGAAHRAIGCEKAPNCLDVERAVIAGGLERGELWALAFGF